MLGAKNRAGRRRSWVACARRAAFPIVVMLVAPLAISYGIRTAEGALHWSEARRDSSLQAPDPKVELDAVVQVYAGRAWGWRGAFGVHTWIATKRRGAEYYVRHEVIGWGVRHGSDAVRVAQFVHADGLATVVLSDPSGDMMIGGVEQGRAKALWLAPGAYSRKLAPHGSRR